MSLFKKNKSKDPGDDNALVKFDGSNAEKGSWKLMSFKINYNCRSSGEIRNMNDIQFIPFFEGKVKYQPITEAIFYYSLFMISEGRLLREDSGSRIFNLPVPSSWDFEENSHFNLNKQILIYSDGKEYKFRFILDINNLPFIATPSEVHKNGFLYSLKRTYGSDYQHIEKYVIRNYETSKKFN
ncbi:M protein [Almendravirus balsa]|uniref:M protein n=1 Tax=Almendravirus balsa TaxID=1972684 RepID=UPI001E281B7E|nr:M protein [Almendravirus balsa]